MYQFASVLFKILVASTLATVTSQNILPKCYTNFKRSSGLKMDRLIVTDIEKNKQLVAIGISGLLKYKMEYSDKKASLSLKISIGLSDNDYYSADTALLVSHYQKLVAEMGNRHDDDLSSLNYNGYKIYKYNRGIIDSHKFETFVMFPEKGVIVWYQFEYLNISDSNPNVSQALFSQRNAFLGEYTTYLRNCSPKK